jgi:peptide-methionine (S)-S-oxide reductase
MQGMRQGKEAGMQYRSAVYATTDEQLAHAYATREAFAAVIRASGRVGRLAGFYYAEDAHQQYLSESKNPSGYCDHGPNGIMAVVVRVGVAALRSLGLTAWPLAVGFVAGPVMAWPPRG